MTPAKLVKLIFTSLVYTASFIIWVLVFTSAANSSVTYPIVDTGQDRCYDNWRSIKASSKGQAFFGQDAQYVGNKAAYRDNGDGTVTDLVTGLMWQKTPDLKNKKTFDQAVRGAASFRLAGYDDWRLPTIKELYSLIDFRGDTGRSASSSVPYINTDYFDFVYGDTTGGRVIDAQYWSSTEYVSTTMNGNRTTFGVNFADGRIKGYPQSSPRGQTRQFVRYVRGNPAYGVNRFVDNGDGTISDQATGLTWMKADSGKAMTWQQALSYAESLSYAGHNDWRLPNAKELQSIVDYSRAPSAFEPSKRTAAIDPIFGITQTESWFWTSTTHVEHGRATQAAYVAFGRAFGYMSFGRNNPKTKMDVHGAGAQRSDPKSGDPERWPTGRGPQGDEIRIYNYVRCVRGGAVLDANLASVVIDQNAYPYRYKSTAVALSQRDQTDQMDEPRQGPPGGPPGGDSSGDGPPGGGRGRQNFIDRLDRDGDGKISRQEFDGPAEHFDRFDRNNDGYISADEAPTGPPPRRRLGNENGRPRNRQSQF